MNEIRQQRRFYKTEDGKKILTCIQCGTCSGSCPLSDRMDHAPRELFALIREGEMAAVLSADTPWFCVSCYQCIVRCPREIPVTDLMYHLKRMAIESGFVPQNHKLPSMYQAFSKEVKRSGRISEAIVMTRYGMSHPIDLFSNIFNAVKLFIRGRISLTGWRMKRPDIVKRILKGEEE